MSPPDSPALILSANGPQPLTLQSHDQLATSRASPCNVFDVELGKLRNGTETPQFDSTGCIEGNHGCLSNEELGYDNLRGFENIPPGSGKLYGSPRVILVQLTGFVVATSHPILEQERNIGTTGIQTPPDLSSRPSCLSEQVRFEDFAASTLPDVDQRLDQVSQHRREDEAGKFRYTIGYNCF